MRTNTHFEPGDVVAIREWDDMAAEYGMCTDHIECKFHFVEGMRKYCGREFTLKYVGVDGIVSFDVDAHLGFSFSTDMIRHIDDEVPGDLLRDEDIEEDSADSFFAIIGSNGA